uniref:Myosin-2 heavy chain n=1 Tax=Zeugodacus cucurbitae TaxID=28588 RepID=A0A0A1WU21_ZEUCU
MFNLLRRSSKKKKKSNQEKSPNAARYSAGATQEERAASSGCDKAQKTASIERYRSYNEWQREREREREFERERQRDERRIGLPTHAYAGKRFERAEIEEFDDLKDLEEDEYDYCDDDDDARSDESGLATVGRKSLLAGRGGDGAVAFERCSYFRSKRLDGEREREVGDNINLAKTTAANNTKVTNTVTAHEETDASARDGGVVTAASSVASSASPNKVATLHSNDFNVDIINKFSSNLSKLDGHNDDEHEHADEDFRFERPCDAAERGEYESLNRYGSSNAEAVWQGRTLPVVNSGKSNKNDRCINRSIIDSAPYESTNQTASSAACAENVERADATPGSENRIRHGNGDAIHGDEQIALATDTANAAAINEVKYRNLVKTNKTPKAQKSHEAKRQSRLSLTLGLNLKGARSKSITDVSAANTDSSSITGYYSGSSSCSGRGPRKRSQLGKAFRYSFLRGRSKSSDTETTPFEEDDSAVSVLENSKTDRSVNGVGSKAFRKSKEFLSDLFMARGRNHNRSRNTQAQLQSAAQNPQLHIQQQQQQQKLAQLQQQKQQQALAKDNRTLAPVSAPTNVNNNSHPHHNHQQQQRQQRNTHNNSFSSPTNPVAVMQNGQNNSVSTHLELIPDPSDASTNSYQITKSNNSVKNVSRTAEYEERQRRSNSAGEQQLSARAAAMDAGLRARSADPQWSTSGTGAQHESRVIEEESAAQRLNEPRNGECDVIREIRVELNGTFKTAGTDNNNAEQPNNRAGCIADELRKNNTNNASKQNEATKVEGEQCAIESDVEVEDSDAVSLHESDVEVGGNSALANGNQCNAEVTTCSAAREAPHSAFPLTATTTTTASVPTNIASFDREACDIPSSIPTDSSSSSSVYPSDAESMGQTNAKPSDAAPSTHADTPGEFRENVSPETNSSDANASVDDTPRVPILPKITVVDCSGSQENSLAGSPVEQEVFYDFENKPPNRKRESAGVEISVVDEVVENIEDDDDVFHDQEIPATVYQPKWPLRYNHTKLENVPEQEETEDETDLKYVAADGDADSMADSDSDDVEAGAGIDVTKLDGVDNLDIEYEDSQHFDSPERSTLKSGNTSDSNLSTSYPDSGISSHCSSTSSYSRRHSSSDNETRATRSTKSGSPIMQQHYNNNNNNRHQQQHTSRLPFVRDGNSTDCDETLMQCDDLDYLTEVVDPNERLVCIESISLPDVVVESTTGSSVANTSASSATASGKGDSEQIININGATGNSIGNVHFIPIHVEGSDPPTPKRRSLDDSVLGSGGSINKSFAHMNGLHQKSTVEIIEEDTELTNGTANGYQSKEHDATVEKLRRELIEQKSRYNTQIGDAQKNVQNLQNKVSEMQAKIEKLEQEMSAKAWNVERLQGELRAAQKDDDFVRKRLKLLEDEKTSLRHKYSENEDEFRRKYEELETQYHELETKYNETKSLASNLQTQLATAQSEAEEWRKEVEKIRGELEAQIQILKNALENSEAERKICQDKWQKEFEMLRTQNQDREENLMADCEWQLRQIHLQAKDKTDKLLHERQLAMERTEQLHNELEERKQEVEGLKVYQAEVKSLRGVVAEQESAIKTLMQQIDNIKSELHTANTDLEEQMKAVKKIKNQCDNALCDKEREVVHRINEVRNQAAVFWEDKLYTEMTRLKTELESVYVDERREALDKLQAEHIEELRALTTRYTANEDELRVELNEVQERFERKNEEFIEMRDKSDTSLLQMRMHLDRADREYQNAMCREEERRETLEANLRKEFEAEREEMEEKFRERLSQVKEEFAKELQDSTQEMRQKYQKELEQQKAKLQAEKEEALQELSDRHRKKLAAVEEQIKEIELRHKHDLKDLKAAYDTEKSAMDKRDISNTNEIEQLHRKCRCLTNLFEEMRMRYERRDPRPEDLREIDELRTRCESQERDLFELTDRLREMQIQMNNMQANGEAGKKPAKPVKKPPPKTIPTNCDVIYEDENEERESPPPQTATSRTTTPLNEDEEDAEEEEDDDDDDEEEDQVENKEVMEATAKKEKTAQVTNNQTRIVNGDVKTANLIISNNDLNKKNINTINEDDESHMITAM